MSDSRDWSTYHTTSTWCERRHQGRTIKLGRHTTTQWIFWWHFRNWCRYRFTNIVALWLASQRKQTWRRFIPRFLYLKFIGFDENTAENGHIIIKNFLHNPIFLLIYFTNFFASLLIFIYNDNNGWETKQQPTYPTYTPSPSPYGNLGPSNISHTSSTMLVPPPSMMSSHAPSIISGSTPMMMQCKYKHFI